jgi:hypothetical protein
MDRTTLTIDPDVRKLLEDEVHRTRRPFKQVVNEALRRGLAVDAPRPPKPPFKVIAFGSGPLMPGIDPDKLNQLNDELEVEAMIEKLERLK